MTRQSWALAPHDPLVLGIGRRLPALLPRMTRAVPLPATLAGAIRAQFAGGRVDLDMKEAWNLLQSVSLRGPWLQRGNDEIFVRAPLHIRAYGHEGPRTLEFPHIEKPKPNEGFLLHDGAPSTMLTQLHWPESPPKAKPLDEYLHVNTVRDLLLGTCKTLGPPEKLFEFEGRVHVTINQLSQTAEPGALYSSSGVRYADDVSIALEVTHSLPEPQQRFFVLGGETRTVARHDGKNFPVFDKSVYERALEGHDKRVPGLLLMLVTPASYSTAEGDQGPGWLPRWLKNGQGEVEGIRLTLETIATDRFIPLSGWSMAHREKHPQGQQRAVRRLVPAGTVYFLRIEDGGQEAWVRLCKHFWGQPIDKSDIGDEAALLAAPWRDGYGMVIPGLYWPDGEST